MIYLDLSGKFFDCSSDLSRLYLKASLQEYLDENPDVMITDCCDQKLWEEAFEEICCTRPYTDISLSDDARYDILMDGLVRAMQYRLIFPNEDKRLLFVMSM